MPKPLIQKSEPRPSNPNQPPAMIIDNPSAASVAQALASGKRQIDATK